MNADRIHGTRDRRRNSRAFVSSFLCASGCLILFGGALAAQEPFKEKYKEVEVSGGGSIKGRVTFSGTPTVLKLRVNQDKTVCTHASDDSRPSTRLQVCSSGGVKDTIVYIEEIAQGKPLSEFKPAATLEQQDCTYVPFVQAIPYKSVLKITNGDALNHNVHARLDDKSLFNFAMPNKGAVLDKRMVWPGIITFNCDVHIWMSAYVLVVKHPYYATTDEEGVFELKDIPPGDYKLVAWHPGWEAEIKTNAQGQPIGYQYAAPVVRIAPVSVTPGGCAKIDFALNP